MTNVTVQAGTQDFPAARFRFELLGEKSPSHQFAGLSIPAFLDLGELQDLESPGIY
jgi:hypothetical protein